MRRLTSTASLLLVLLALVAAGCGGDDNASSTAPVDEWATDFCSAVTDWTDELQRISESIGDPSSLSVDALRDAGDEAGNATDAFVEDLRALGTPDTESGEEIRSSLETLSDTLETETDDLSEAIDAVEGLSDLGTAISAIGASLTAMGEAFRGALESLENSDVDGEVESAFQDSAACDELQG